MIRFDVHEWPSDVPLVKKRVDLFLAHLNDEFGAKVEGVVNIKFVNDTEIRRLNRMYRDQDKVTDVLSFIYEDNLRESDIIGDVIISLEQAKRQAENDDFELEVADLLVHGVLHVLGFDHEISPEEAEKMFELQDKFVSLIL